MRDQCISSNEPERGGVYPEAVLQPPFQERTVCVDYCIATAIQSLWLAGIVTRGCCCGHGDTPPSVVLDVAGDGRHAAAILSADGRAWQVLAWMLTDVSRQERPAALATLTPSAPAEKED